MVATRLKAVAPRSKTSKNRRNGIAYLWIFPALLLTAFVLIVPLGRVVWESFTDKSLAIPGPGTFIGPTNYLRLVDDPLFWLSFRNNLILLLSVPISILIALWTSGVLYRKIRGSRLYEVLIFIPFLPAVASISVIFIYLLRPNGPFNQLLELVGLDRFTVSWRTNPTWAIWAVLGVVTWKRIGFLVLLFMTRLLSLDRELFDAAAVDGASWNKVFRHIALPQMKSIIQFAGVLSFIEVFSFTFAYIYVLTRGGPFNQTLNLENYLFRQMFNALNVGAASAVAVVLLLLATAVAVYRAWSARKETAAA